jgi:endonuclease/exonuclease/phosphatase (EEP) superfamily protein YafD
MLKPLHSPQHIHHHQQHLGHEFGLLCWNVHKETLRPEFEPLLHHLLQTCPSELLLLQEAKTSLNKPLKIAGFSYAMSTNIQTRQHLYGVLSAAKASFEEIRSAITQTREVRLATHKSFLITTHLLPDGEPLLVVNIHSINFVPQKYFSQELKRIYALLNQHTGAMIVAGDFNNWTKKRQWHMEEFRRDLGLELAPMHSAHHIKRLFRKPLDHVFYRGLTLLEAKALDTGSFSDHNPIYARFAMNGENGPRP